LPISASLFSSMVAVGETDMGVWVEEEAEAMTDTMYR
jgi:hypothetical protein